jgi:hypothetical protein
VTYIVDGIRQAFSSAGVVNITIDILVLIALIPVLVLPAKKLLTRRFT